MYSKLFYVLNGLNAKKNTRKLITEQTNVNSLYIEQQLSHKLISRICTCMFTLEKQTKPAEVVGIPSLSLARSLLLYFQENGQPRNYYSNKSWFCGTRTPTVRHSSLLSVYGVLSRHLISVKKSIVPEIGRSRLISGNQEKKSLQTPVRYYK